MVWNLLQSSFMQSILSLVPSLRKSIEGPPESPELPPSPAIVEPWKEEVDRWRQLADKTAAERDQLRHEASQLHMEMQRLVDDLGQARVEAEEAWKSQEAELKKQSEEELRRREEELQRKSEEEIKKREEDLQKAKEELRKVEVNVDELTREKTTIQASLQSCQGEAEELRRVLGTDHIGEPDVTKLLLTLNTEIAQTAKAAKEMFRLDKNTRANSKVSVEAASAVEGWVGSALPGLLATQYRGNAVLVQAALQALAVAFASWISSSYSFMHEHDQILDETYKSVMHSESQVVLGRWRALTHKYAKQGMPNLTDELTKMFTSDVRNILLVAGSSTFQIDTLVSRNADKFRAIIEAAISLRKAIGEDIISCDFEPLLVQPGDSFDAASMDSGFPATPNQTATAGTKVICTSAMGLRRCKKLKGDAWDVIVLTKPQVVLESAL